MKQKKILSNIFVYIMAFVVMVSISALSVNAAQLPVNLGTAGDFAILSKSGISTTGTTSITGDIGVSPIDSTAITGFGLVMDASNEFSTSSPDFVPLQVTGKVYAADYTPPTPAKMTTAVSDMETAFTDAQGRTTDSSPEDTTELGAGDISGMTIVPGLHKWSTGVLINAGSVTGDPNGVTLDCQGDANAVFIFQIAKDLTVGNGAQVTLINGCQAKNIFWAVAENAVPAGVTLGTTSVFKGNILAVSAITLATGANLNGRALAQTAVTLDANTIVVPPAVTPSDVDVCATAVCITSANSSVVDPLFIPKLGSELIRGTAAYLGRTSTYTGPATNPFGEGTDTIKWKVTIEGPSALTADMVDLDEVGTLDTPETISSLATSHYPFSAIGEILVTLGSCDVADLHDNSCLHDNSFSLDENDIFTNADKIVFNSNAPLGVYTIKYELVDTRGTINDTTDDVVLSNVHAVTLTLTAVVEAPPSNGGSNGGGSRSGGGSKSKNIVNAPAPKPATVIELEQTAPPVVKPVLVVEPAVVQPTQPESKGTGITGAITAFTSKTLAAVPLWVKITGLVALIFAAALALILNLSAGKKKVS